MQVEINGHHVDVTPALRQHIEQKLDKVHKLFDKITHAHVTLTVEKKKKQQKAEAKLLLSGTEIFADSTTNDMYASIDLLSKKLTTQVQKYKEKLKDHGTGELH